LSAFTARSGTQADQQSKELRFHIWKEAFGYVKQSPIVGVGAKNIQINFKDVPGYEDRVWSEAHNIYIQQAAEKGLVGLGLMLWVFIVMLRLFLKSPVAWRPALVSVLVAFLVAGLTESWINDAEVAMIFWTMAGLACAFIKGAAHDVA
jgi:O-antigen ligase